MLNGLEPGPQECAKWLKEVLDFQAGYALKPGPKIALGAQAFNSSHDLASILAVFAEGVKEAVPTTNPGFMAYVPGGGLPSAALANFLGSYANRFTGLHEHAPLLVDWENVVIRWLCDAFDLPKTAFGLLTSGGSMANWIALVCARTQILGESGDFSKARLYVSDQVHHSVQRAAFLACIPH